MSSDFHPGSSPDAGRQAPYGVADLACVVVTFNSSAVIDDCLASLLRSGVRPAQIYVVDNASTDNTVSRVSRDYPDANIITASENLGFSKANNLAARQSSSDLLMFANPDLIFLPGAVEAMVSTLSAKMGICGPLFVDRRLKPKPESYLLPPTFGGLLLMHTYLWKPVYLVRRLLDELFGPAPPRKRDVLSGACIVTRRGDFLELGGFDEDFFMYAEDLDLCRRFSRAGWDIAQVTAARVIHIGGGTYVGSRMVFFNSLRSSDTMLVKNSDGAASLTVKRLIVMAGLSLRWAAYRLSRNPHESGELAARLAEGLRAFFSRELFVRKPLSFPGDRTA